MASKMFLILSSLAALSSAASYAACPANEVLAKCVDAVCWKTCEHLVTKPACIAIADCDKPGCVCREGYLRNSRGICVPARNCPAPSRPSCPANEVLAKCSDAVCWKTCEHLITKPACIAIADCDKPACVCRDGYLRNSRGLCVPTERCPSPPQPSCPANEVFAKCAEAVCWKTCEDLINKPACIAIADCDNPTCVCKEGFSRNSRDVCIPNEYCPAPYPGNNRCSTNEVFVKCTDAVCVKTCEHLRNEPFCVAVADCNKPGCLCRKGFLRNGRGQCVPQNYCPAY